MDGETNFHVWAPVRDPRVLQLIMDSLRYWVLDMHVDGFRFDLASALARAAATPERVRRGEGAGRVVSGKPSSRDCVEHVEAVPSECHTNRLADGDCRIRRCDDDQHGPQPFV